MIVGNAHSPALPRRRAGYRDVASECDESAGAGLRDDVSNEIVGGPRFGGRSEIEFEPVRNVQQTSLAIELDLSPRLGSPVKRAQRPAVAGAHSRESAVVTGGSQFTAERGIDDAISCPRGLERDEHRLGQEL